MGEAEQQADTVSELETFQHLGMPVHVGGNWYPRS